MKEENIYKKLCIVVISIFTIFLTLVVCYTQPTRTGDGGEYMMQVEAILNHASTDIRDSDYDSARDAYGESMTVELYEWNTYPNHHFKTTDGRSYAPHFGGYALFSVPAKLILKFLGLNQFRCFMVTNAIMYLLALMVVFCASKLSYKKIFHLLLLLSVNPALFYIRWVHTEIFSFSLVIIGLVYYYRKRYKCSILFVSLAAMQNVGLMFLGMAIGLDFCKSIFSKYFRKDEKADANIGFSLLNFLKYDGVEFIIAGLCYIPGLMSIIHTLVNFGKINLVATVARENEHLLQKVWAYWTDLNLGLLPYFPILLLLFIYLNLRNLNKNKWQVFCNILTLAGIYYILANQRQINSGMSGMMRYNVWVVPILIFYVVYNIDEFIFSQIRYILLSFSTITTLIMMLWAININNGHIRLYGDNEFAPWTKVILKYAPDWYNPFKGIFITRATGKETYDTEIPIIYQDEEGFIRKVLVPNNDQINDINVNGSLDDIDYFEQRKSNLKNINYQYINIPFEKKLKASLRTLDKIKSDDVNENYIENGIYKSEGNYFWISSEADFKIKSQALNQDFLLIKLKILPEILECSDINMDRLQ